MNYDEFVDDVQNRTHIATKDEVEDACCAALNVLGERLSEEKAAMLAGRIPAELSECLKQMPGGGQFGIAEFYKKVADRIGVDTNVAADYARAIGRALDDAIGRTPFEEIVSVLPYEYDELFGLERVERTGRRAA